MGNITTKRVNKYFINILYIIYYLVRFTFLRVNVQNNIVILIIIIEIHF